MLCSEIQLVKQNVGYTDIKPLPCNRWSCELCAPRRRRKLIAIAASGEPTTFLTLTVNPNIGENPLDRRNKLHDAWKRLVKRMLRQFALPPAKRWILEVKRRSRERANLIYRITKATVQAQITAIHYMAFLERTDNGEPHLHILMRVPFIPQDWISEQMAEMIGAPIVDIRKVKSTRAAVFYVTKYVTEAPAQFGTTKRYWISKKWEVNKSDRPERDEWKRGEVRVIRRRYTEWQDEIQISRQIAKLLPHGWIRIYPRNTPWEQWGDFREPVEA